MYVQAETGAQNASERVARSAALASSLGQLAENVAAVTKVSNDALDLELRNLRLASRRDVTRLSSQLRRTKGQARADAPRA